MGIKKHEEKAEESLLAAMNSLSEAEEALGSACADCDNFPTARHELAALRERAGKLKSQASKLLYDVKTKHN